MVFTKRLREGVRRGFITSSVRIWQRPHVKDGGRYRMDEGEIVIDSIELISMQDITHDLAVESGFESRADLLKVAKHGSGGNVYLGPAKRCIRNRLRNDGGTHPSLQSRTGQEL